MVAREIKTGIFAVGATHWERRLFDELIPLPDGTTYNSYLVKGNDKIALLDTVDPGQEPVLLDHLRALKIEKIDYVIAHHAEQDHSGTLPKILALYPAARVVTNPRCKEMLLDLLPIPEEKLITIKDRETLSLGGRTLEFIYAPWVHWPETMFSYLREDKILFTCDFLGSHLATSDLFARDEARVYEAAKRYYAEIMMPFRTSIKKHLETIKPLAIEMIAPSHGPIYDRPEFALNAYRDWVSDRVKNEVVLPYVSMHGSTARLAHHFLDALISRGISVRPFDLTNTDPGKLAMALVDAATLVIGAPVALVGPHPLAVFAAYLVNSLRPKLRFASVIGSYGWSGKLPEQIAGLLPNLKVEWLEPVSVRGFPKAGDFKSLERLADEILVRHQGL